MSFVGDVTNSFYGNFLLRDLVAKITPGVAVLFAALTLKYEPEFLIQQVRDMAIVEIVFFLSAAWILSFAFQALGIYLGLIKQWPYDMPMETSREYIVKFNRQAKIEEKRIVERYVVIKEACGLGHVALAMSIVMILLGTAARNSETPVEALMMFLRISWENCFILLLLVVVVLSLRLSHIKHLERQYSTYKAVAKEGLD